MGGTMQREARLGRGGRLNVKGIRDIKRIWT